jgi:hypothetical protein
MTEQKQRIAEPNLASAQQYSWTDNDTFESWLRRMSLSENERILTYPHNSTGRGKKLQTHRAIHILQKTSVGNIQSSFIVIPDTFEKIMSNDGNTVIGCECDIFDPYSGKYKLKVMKVDVHVTLTPYENYDSSFYERFELQPFNSRHYEVNRNNYSYLLKGLTSKVVERSKQLYRDKVETPIMVDITLFDNVADAYVHTRVLLKIDSIKNMKDQLSFEVYVSSKTRHRMTFYSDKMPLLERNVHL